jgi:hypothetical protein
MERQVNFSQEASNAKTLPEGCLLRAIVVQQSTVGYDGSVPQTSVPFL